MHLMESCQTEKRIVFSCITQLVKLLERADLNLRIAAGETAALVYELGRASRIHFQGPVNVLHTYLRDYANESGRHKGKKEKRLQKASFRDILKTVEVNFKFSSRMNKEMPLENSAVF